MITKSGKYGIRAMMVLAQLPAGESLGVPQIAHRVDVPQSYLSKLLRLLLRVGLVHSQRGLGGGFWLARPAAAISLYDIIEPLESMERWSTCFLGNENCSDEQACAMHDRWKMVQQAYLELLKENTLAEFAEKRAFPQPFEQRER